DRAGVTYAHRTRARGDPRGRDRGRRARRRLRAAAPAARAEGHLARMAATALPGARRARDEPGPADARGQGLRQHLRPAHARRRTVRRTAGDAFFAGAPAPRLRAPAATRDRPVPPTPPGLAAGRTGLTVRPAPAPHGRLRTAP